MLGGAAIVSCRHKFRGAQRGTAKTLCAVRKNNMSNINRRISAALANGAEYLAMGEIAAHTGLLVSQAPRNNANFDVM